MTNLGILAADGIHNPWPWALVVNVGGGDALTVA